MNIILSILVAVAVATSGLTYFSGNDYGGRDNILGAISFPTSLDTLTNPSATDSTATVSHSGQHSDANDGIEALQAKVGVDGSAVTTSHDYKLSGVTGSDLACSLAGTETLTNKTLTSATLTSPIMTTIENSGTLTLPTGADTLVGRATTDTLTNKTISGSSNTLTVLAASQLSGATPIANGGTGQTGQTAAFDALSPLTTKGDMIASNGSDNIRVGVGANGQVLQSDSTASGGVSWLTLASQGTWLYASSTDIVITGTTNAETSIFSESIAGGTLGSDRAIKVMVFLSDYDDNVADPGLDFKLKFGTATTVTAVIDPTSAVTNITGVIEFILMGDGDTSSQEAISYTRAGSEGTDPESAVTQMFDRVIGSASIDSTSSQTLELTVNHSGSSGGTKRIEIESVLVELITS